MSDQERICWGSLIANLVIGGWYFTRIFSLPADANLLGGHVAHFAMLTVLVSIVLGIVSGVLLRLVQKRTGGGGGAIAADERDALIELKAQRNGYYTLGFAVAAVLVQIALVEFMRRMGGHQPMPGNVLERIATGPIEAQHVFQLLLLALTVSSIVSYASRILAYRRGA